MDNVLKAYMKGKQVKLHWLKSMGFAPVHANNLKQWRKQAWQLNALHAWLEKDGLLREAKNG